MWRNLCSPNLLQMGALAEVTVLVNHVPHPKSEAGEPLRDSGLTQLPVASDVLLIWVRANIQRKQKIRLRHSVLRGATYGTRLGFQGDLCSTACTKSGHVNLHNCYDSLDERRKCKDSRQSSRHFVN